MSLFMTELSYSDARTHEMEDFENLFWLGENKPVLVILELEKYDDCVTFVNK